MVKLQIICTKFVIYFLCASACFASFTNVSIYTLFNTIEYDKTQLNVLNYAKQEKWAFSDIFVRVKSVHLDLHYRLVTL